MYGILDCYFANQMKVDIAYMINLERTHNNHTMWGNGWNATISIIEPRTKGFIYSSYYDILILDLF